MEKHPLVLITLLAALALVAGCTGGETEMETMADTLAASIDAGLEGLRADIGENARALATTGLTGPEAGQVLATPCGSIPGRYHRW
ncbi:MAG: hypothetical protein ACP5C4_04430 [Methanomicrobiales archaeon]